MHTKWTARRLAADAMFAAMVTVLGLVSISTGNLKITVEALPVFLGALLLGPVDGLAIGGVGTLLYQLLRFGVSGSSRCWPCSVSWASRCSTPGRCTSTALSMGTIRRCSCLARCRCGWPSARAKASCSRCCCRRCCALRAMRCSRGPTEDWMKRPPLRPERRFLRGEMMRDVRKKQPGRFLPGCSIRLGRRTAPVLPPAAQTMIRSSIGAWPVIRRRASNPAPGDNDTQSNFGCSR